MSKTWPEVKLGEVISQYREYIEQPEPKQYPKLSVKLYGKGVVLDSSVDGSILKMKRHQLAKAGQVILSEIWGKKGAIGFVPHQGEGALCTSHFFLFDIHSDKLTHGWLSAIFRANYLAEQLNSKAFGTTGYAAVRPKDLLQTKIPLPPLAGQQRIVAKIQQLAGKIEEAKELREQISEKIEAVIVSIHAKFSGTKKKKLGDIITLDEDKVLIEKTGEYPQVGVKSFGCGLFPKSAVNGTETTYKTFNRLYDGAIVLSQVKGWEGAIGVCNKNLAGWYVSPEYRTFRCIQNEALPKYMAPLVQTEWFWKHLKNATRGVGARRERTRPEQFLSIQIPMPDIQLQKVGQQLFNKMETLKHLQVPTATELDALLPSILDKAFKGEL